MAIFAEAVAEHCAAGGIAIAATHVDLGLGPGPVISMTDFPAAAPGRAEADGPGGATGAAEPPDDPFLSGAW